MFSDLNQRHAPTWTTTLTFLLQCFLDSYIIQLKIYYFLTNSTLFSTVLIIFLIFNASGGYALILGTIFSDKQLAVTLTPVLIIPFMLFAGFFVNQNNIPWFLKEFEYLSIFKYGFQALVLNEFQDLQLKCMTETNFGDKCNPLGEMDFREDLPTSILALVAMYVGCNFIALLIMMSLSKKYE